MKIYVLDTSTTRIIGVWRESVNQRMFTKDAELAPAGSS
ncbi:MAG: hypothetical protein OJF50_005245 [Nitrospira sp.]|nr:hypothetical protein [Nitrospira sp.]